MFCSCKIPKPINLSTGLVTCAICTKLILSVISQESKFRLENIPEVHNKIPAPQITQEANMITASGTAPTMNSGASGLQFSLDKNLTIDLENFQSDY